MIEKITQEKETFTGNRVAISGSDNIVQYTALKVIELGSTIVSLSDSKGAIIVQDGNTSEKVQQRQEAKVKFQTWNKLLILPMPSPERSSST